VFEYGDLLHAPFNTSGFEALLAQLFSQPGCHNDFRGLKGASSSAPPTRIARSTSSSASRRSTRSR